MRADRSNVCRAVRDARADRAIAASEGIRLGRGLSMRQCACGGTVSGNPDDPTPGVRDHQRTPEHRAYRARNHSEPLADPTADCIRVDLSAVVSVRPARQRRGWARVAVR
jgi:hypothetical protein